MTKKVGLPSYILLFVYAVIVLVPLLDLVLLSFKHLSGIVSRPFSLPRIWHFANYATAWKEGNLAIFLMNTAWVAVAAVFGIVFLSSMAAYALARFNFRGNQWVYLFFLAGLALPIQMIAIPLFILMRHIDLLNNLVGLVLVYMASGLAFSVFLLVNFIRNVPKELEEAAFLDGANHFHVYWYVILPLVRPTLGTVGILNFISAWNNFFFPLILLSSPHKMTVAVGVMSFVGQYATQWNLLLPALVIVTLPTILLFVLVAKQFVRNLTAGAIKM